MFARLFRPRRACQSARRRHGVLSRPLLEVLEDRTLLSVYMVDRPSDAGEGSDLTGDLRYCIAHATDGDTVQFGVQGVINLTHALPLLAHGITINGPGQDVLAVSGDHHDRIFAVSRGTTVNISGLTLENGTVNALSAFGGDGGAIS